MVRHQVVTNAQKHEHLAVAVKHRIVKCAKFSHFVRQPGQLSVQHIEHPGKKRNGSEPEHIPEIAPIAHFATGNQYNG